jgi:hypothetical protein
MRNLTPSELFSKGYIAMKKKEYLMAEKYFLASLFENTKQEDYMSLLGSLDKLSLYLYPQGNYESKDRVLEFYKVFSKVDENVSLGYAMAIINGVFGDADYNQALRQLSKAMDDDKLFITAYLLNEGKGFEKDEYKAALFLKSKRLKGSNRSQQAKKLYNTIGIKIELNEEQLKKEIDEKLKEIFKVNTLELEKYPITKESLLIEFFKNKENIPDIGIETNEDLTLVKEESDFDWQVRNIANIFHAASMAPVFKQNPKYCTRKFADLTPYISYNDVRNYKYTIRARPLGENNSFDSEERDIIIQYDSIEQLVKDGWILD